MVIYLVTFIIMHNQIISCEQDLTTQLRLNQQLIDGYINYSSDMTKYTIREYYENKCDSWRLCEVKSKSLDYSLEGIYNTEGFYCVNTKDRSNEEIATTEQHEIAHVLVDEDYKHFCQDKKR